MVDAVKALRTLLAAYDAQASRLAAVEQAARAWADNLFLTDAGAVDLERNLREVVANPDAPSGESL